MIEQKIISLIDFIKMLGLTTESEGRALWEIIANRRIFMNGIPVESGSFRHNGAMIAKVCGGDYMNYYCSSGQPKDVDKIMNKFMDLLVVTEEI